VSEPRRNKRPQPISSAISNFLEQAGIRDRVEQATVVPEWPSLVGTQIAAVTEPLSVTSDGILFVAVKTHAWMSELSLLEPELLASLNRAGGRAPVKKIRWTLMREPDGR
jgi:predicted nucleic acid-binding Zn ribbon protein